CHVRLYHVPVLYATTIARHSAPSPSYRKLLTRFIGRTDPGLDLEAKLPQLRRLDARRRPGHRVDPGLVLREGDQLADERLVEERHEHAFHPGGDASVRRRAHR